MPSFLAAAPSRSSSICMLNRSVCRARVKWPTGERERASESSEGKKRSNILFWHASRMPVVVRLSRRDRKRYVKQLNN